jgi:hypothetical protein
MCGAVQFGTHDEASLCLYTDAVCADLYLLLLVLLLLCCTRYCPAGRQLRGASATWAHHRLQSKAGGNPVCRLPGLQHTAMLLVFLDVGGWL